jgi:polysaccharide export outer membrane protein
MDSATASGEARALPPPPREDSPDRNRLAALLSERALLDPDDSYRIGPGDLIEIMVFDLPEMNRKVRVGSSGLIQLPLIGSVKAAGQSEDGLTKEIAQRLEKNYLQNPQVDAFVEEYKSQQVAVTGSVSKPGLIPLTKKRYTILDLISEAGGLTKDAGAIIQFIPAEPARRSAEFDAVSAGSPLPSVMVAADSRGIILDLPELMRGNDRSALGLRVMPGDVIFVPEAGSFTIEGWVDKPGTYPLTRNMTVLAALSAGGGALFPSRLSTVEILRDKRGSGRNRDAQTVDLNAVRDGKVPDVELRSGDIVRVPGYKMLMVPWGMYTFVKSLISIGASIPII